MSDRDGIYDGQVGIDVLLRAVPVPSELSIGASGGGLSTSLVRCSIESYYQTIARVGEAWLSRGDRRGELGLARGVLGEYGELGRGRYRLVGGVAGRGLRTDGECTDEAVGCAVAGVGSGLRASGCGEYGEEGVDQGVRVDVGVQEVGDVSSAEKVGKWRKKNLRKKQKKMEKDSQVGGRHVSGADVKVDGVDSMKSEARKTLEAKWVVENKLARLKAEQELEIVKKRDLLKEAKKREVETMRRTESAKVAVEKSFATLRRTGNVIGHCETVVSGVPGLSDGSGSEGDCTISPDSSISRAEVQEMQKQLLDYQKRAEDAEKLLRRREIMEKTTYVSSVAEFSAGSESVMSDGLKCELDRKFGERYEYEGKIDGKHVVRRLYHDGGMDDDSVCDEFLGVY